VQHLLDDVVEDHESPFELNDVRGFLPLLLRVESDRVALGLKRHVEKLG
jgi:hypothetical protein